MDSGLPAATAVLAIATALFAVGAGIIAVFGGAAARAGGSAELWRHYGATVLFAAAVLVPAALHPALFAALAALAAWRVVLELADLQRLELRPVARAVVGLAALGTALLGRESQLLLSFTLLLLLVGVPVYARAMQLPIVGSTRWIFALAFPLLATLHLSALAHAAQGFLWICFLYAVVEVQDSMAFLFGKLFGRRALAPRISPRKTLEGAIAGALSGTLVGVLIGVLLLDVAWPLAAALALLVAAAGFGGDLFASALKRAAGVKDFRALHPRHGGVLDIYDSTLAAAPVAGVFLWLAS